MTTGSHSPDIFWVIGPDTNVGKTTIAAALIRALNREGCPAVGFKPFGALLLQEAMEFGAEQRARSGCELCGSDADRLATASPLTPPSMMDVVGPMYMVSYPVYGRPLLMRMGSRALGNVRYLFHEGARRVLSRSDVVELLQQLEVPLATTEATKFTFVDTPSLYLAAQAEAYARLLKLEPRAVVIEGASRYLPIWTSMVVNHILVVTGQEVTLHPGINVGLPFVGQLKATRDMMHHLSASPRSLAVPMTLARPGEREAVAAGIVDRLLEQAGLPGRQ
jgi:hypothetical protein